MTSRLRPGGPTVAVRTGGLDVDVGDARKLVEGRVNSEESGAGSLMNSSSDGPALRRSLKVVLRGRE